ncbi:hypothetical protein JVT61DRAFT_9407 [Boletus reticuloceps]|uniref:Helicase-associated domain-containing protein n=1 Tax=Boletus reticuloceps TaxID=495285 RepID=A0A8I2YG86_9AGAM|nr:hypothetical protein JVT61DRAFT_9407 [Boletus reticuloceps]
MREPRRLSLLFLPPRTAPVSTGSVSRGTNVAEDDKQAKLDNLQFARKMQGSYEQPITQLSSDREGRASSDHMDRASIPNAPALVTPEPQHAPTLESFDVDSGTQVESTDSIPKSPLPLLTTPSGKDTVSSSSDAHGMQGSLDYAGEDLDTTMLDRPIERIENEEVHMDTSRELPLQNHDTYITSPLNLTTDFRPSIGAPTNEQTTVSQTNLQESTIENERSVVMKGTEYKATDTESGQSNLVVCPPMLRGNDQGTMDRCPASASTSPIDLEVHNPPSLDGDLGITNSSSTIWMTWMTNEHFSGVQRPPLSMGIDTVVNFPFPTPPDTQALKKAETVLTHLGAVSSTPLVSSTTPEASIATIGGRITPLGKSMSLFPLAPRYSRMLVAGRQHDCLPYVITIVSIMTLHASLGKSTSDIFRILSVVGAYGFARGGLQFCSEHFVRPKAMEEIHKLSAQLCNIVSATFPGVETGLAKPLKPPNATQVSYTSRFFASYWLAVRKDHVQKKSTTGVQYSTAKGVPYRAMGVEEDVFIHPSSVLSQRSPPDYIIFTEIVKTTKPWLKGLTLVNPTWLSTLGKPTLCTFTKPAKNSAGVLMTIPKFGPDQWELPPIKAS